MDFFRGAGQPLQRSVRSGGGSIEPSGPQAPVVVEMRAGKIGRAATGSPQPPPPWRRAASLRRRPVCSAAGSLHKINRAAISGPQPPPGGGPQLASRRSASSAPPQAASRIRSVRRSIFYLLTNGLFASCCPIPNRYRTAAYHFSFFLKNSPANPSAFHLGFLFLSLLLFY